MPLFAGPLGPKGNQRSARWAARAGFAAIPTFIIDTDFTGDPDDAMALGIAIAAHKAGTAKIVGIVVSSTTSTSAPGVYGVLNAHGLAAAIPVYAYQGALGTYTNLYPTSIRDRFGVAAQLRTAYTDDLTGYRTLIKNNPGVTIIGIGAPVALSRLLSSAGDGIDARTGVQLITQNVAKVVQMAGNFPTGVAEFNASRDVTSTQNVATNWPSTVPFHWMGGEVGGTVFSQPPLDADPLVDPIRYTFDLSVASLTYGRRASWDPLAVYYAIYGAGTQFSLGGSSGSVAVDGTGITTWSATSGPHSYVAKVASDADLAFMLDAACAAAALPAQTPSSQFLLPLTEGTGETIASNNSAIVGALGSIKVAETGVQPAWLDNGTNQWVLNYSSNARYAAMPVDLSLSGDNNIIGSVIANPTATTANQTLMAMYDLGASGKFLFRTAASSKMQFLAFRDAALAANDQYNSGGTDVVAGAWALWSFEILGTALKLYKNGVVILSTPLLNPMPSPPKRTRITLGGRLTATPGFSDGLVGKIAGVGFKAGAVAGDLATMETALRAIATAKGITLP